MPLKVLLDGITKNGRVIILFLIYSPTDSVKSISPEGRVIELLKENTTSPSNRDRSSR